MPQSDSSLLESFPHTRVLWKAGVAFLGILAAIQVLAGWWPPAEAARAAVFAEFWAVPLLFIGFYVVALLYECVIRVYRQELESMRSDPQEPRRAKVKAARKQRLRNQRRR